MNEQNKLVINIRPAEGVTPKSTESVGFLKDIKDAGLVDFNQEEIGTAAGISSSQLRRSLSLYSLGVNSKELEKKIDEAKGILADVSEREKQSLYALPYLIATFEESYPQLSEDLQITYIPEITIQQVPPDFIPQRNQFTFERKNGVFEPIFREVAGRGIDYAKGEIKDFALKAIKKGGKKLLKKGAAVAAKAGITVAAAAVELATPVGWALLAVQAAKKVVSFILKPFKKTFGKIARFITGKRDTKKQLAYLGAGLFLLGAITASIPLVIAGVGTFVLSNPVVIAAAVPVIIAIIASVTVSAIVLPIIIAIILTPIIIAFFLFIINSGAYLVPPESNFIPGGGGSPYIGVEKTADPSGPFSNDVLSIGDGLRITYTITITAKKGSLTNINYDYSCTVIADHEDSCPAIGNVTANGESVSNFQEAMPEEISPVGGPYVITYEQLFKERFKDTATVDTFTITADAEGKPGEKASASEAIVIGNPPLGCFVFSGFKENDPDYGSFLAAAAKLSSHVNYIVKLCAAGDITVKRNYTGTGRGACAGVSGSNLMFFNNCVYYSSHGQAFIDYLFAHESGHIYDHRTSDLSRFITEGVMSEGGLPTYCITQPPPPNEDFADTIGNYVDNGNLGRLCEHNDQRPFHICGGSWPRHCEFAKNVIFEE